MVRIKGWKKIDTNQYENIFGNKLTILGNDQSKIPYSVRTNQFIINLDTGSDIFSIGKSEGYYYKKEAMKSAIKYMKAHPKG